MWQLIKLDELLILDYAEDWFMRAICNDATHTEAHLTVERVGGFREANSENLYCDGQ